MFLVSGSWFLVASKLFQFSVISSRFSVISSQFSVLGSQFAIVLIDRASRVIYPQPGGEPSVAIIPTRAPAGRRCGGEWHTVVSSFWFLVSSFWFESLPWRSLRLGARIFSNQPEFYFAHLVCRQEGRRKAQRYRPGMQGHWPCCDEVASSAIKNGLLPMTS